MVELVGKHSHASNIKSLIYAGIIIIDLDALWFQPFAWRVIHERCETNAITLYFAANA